MGSKDVFLSADVGGFGFDKFDDGAGGFDELSESRLVSTGLCFKEIMPHFWKPFFISATVIDSHSCLKNFVKLVLQQLIG